MFFPQRVAVDLRYQVGYLILVARIEIKLYPLRRYKIQPLFSGIIREVHFVDRKAYRARADVDGSSFIPQFFDAICDLPDLWKYLTLYR